MGRHWVERSDGVIQRYNIAERTFKVNYVPVGGYDRGGGAAKVTRGGRRVRLWKRRPEKAAPPPPPGGLFVRVTVGAGISAEKRRMSFTYQEIVRNRDGDIEAAKLRGREAIRRALPGMVAREMGNGRYKSSEAWAAYLRDNVGFNESVQSTRETSLRVFFDDWSN